jgi:hypothetical protein
MTILVKSSGGIFKFVTIEEKDYLYVDLYECNAKGSTIGLPSRNMSSLSEPKFLEKIQKKAKQLGDTIIDVTK